MPSLSEKFVIKTKIWIEDQNGNHIFGIGLMRLLEKISKLGSLQKAAVALQMSYRAAWGKIKAAEEHLGVSLLDRRIGGQSGGGSKLTSDAKILLERFNHLKEQNEKSLLHFFKDIFSGLDVTAADS